MSKHTPDETLKLTLVFISGDVRCIYLSDYRITGGKPYVSEGGFHRDMYVDRSSLLAALPDEWKSAIYHHTGELPRGYSTQAPALQNKPSAAAKGA